MVNFNWDLIGRDNTLWYKWRDSSSLAIVGSSADGTEHWQPDVDMEGRR